MNFKIYGRTKNYIFYVKEKIRVQKGKLASGGRQCIKYQIFGFDCEQLTILLIGVQHF